MTTSTKQVSIARAVPLAVLAAGLGVGTSKLLVRSFTPELFDLFANWNGPLWLTLRVALMAIIIAGVLGIASGYALAKGRWRGRDLVEAIGSLPIVLPPTVLGYYLLTSLNPSAWFGRVVADILGASPVFNIRGLVIVGVIVAFPFVMRAARSGIEDVEPRMESSARTLGLPEWRVAFVVTLPLARRRIGVGLTLGLLRAYGEYGATLMLGGAYRNHTRTLSIAVLDQPTTEQTEALLRVMLVIAALALGLLARLQRERG